MQDVEAVLEIPRYKAVQLCDRMHSLMANESIYVVVTNSKQYITTGVTPPSGIPPTSLKRRDFGNHHIYEYLDNVLMEQ